MANKTGNLYNFAQRPIQGKSAHRIIQKIAQRLIRCTLAYTWKIAQNAIRLKIHAYLYGNPRCPIRKNLHSHLYANAHSLIRARGTPRYTLCCTPPYTLQCTRTYTHDARAHIRHNARTPIHVILHAGLYANFCTRIYTLYVRLYVKNCTSAYTLLNLASCFSWLDFWRRI